MSIAESATETGESQFRCMLCDFTATSKPEIGNHFLTDHMEAYVSPIKEKGASGITAPGGSSDIIVKEENAEVELEVKEVKEVKKGVAKRKGRPKKPNKTPKRLPVYVEYVEEEEERPLSDEPQQLGRGMRRRKRAVPRHILRYEIEEDEYLDEEYTDNSLKGKKKGVTKKKFPTIMPLTLKEKASRKAQKRASGSPSQDGEFTNEDGSTAKLSKSSKKGTAKPPSAKLPLQDAAIERILEERTTQWFGEFHQKYVSLLPCPFDGCTFEVTQTEMDVHVRCHSPNLQGFRCPVVDCNFLCPHWTNMRVHYRKEHEPSFGKLLCAVDGCTMVFPRIDRKSIDVHVIKKHLRPALYEELLSKDFDISKYDIYVSKTATEDDNSETTGTTAPEDMAPENEANNQASADQPLTTAYPQADGMPAEDLDLEHGSKKSKKRGRPLGSTKAAKIAGLAAGLLPPSKGKKKDKSKRPPRKIVNHVTFFCDVCSAKFKSEEQVHEHKSRHYQDDNFQLIVCTECKEFSSEEPNDIRQHVTDVHKSLHHLHRCEECTFSTNRYHDLKKHIIVHSGSKDYMCDKCGTCTTTAYNLRVHWRRYHAPESEKKISCFACDYKCADNGILKEHIRSKHGLMVYGKDYNNARPMPTYACSQCDYVGRKKSSLMYHLRIHTENRQFKCHICPYASKTKNNLLLHVRTHEGMQPLKCPQCDFRGATNKIISEHVMCKHARVRPYTCKICGWTSSYHGNMWKHVETHRQELGEEMPDEPVSVVSTDGHMVAAPLKAPTLKKRGSGGSPSGSGGSKTPRIRNKRSRFSRYQDVNQVAPQETIIETQVQVQEDAMKDGGVVIQLPVSSMLDNQTITLTGDISEEAAMGASALSRLAQGSGGEITVREVHFIHEGENPQHHHEMISYNVPPVAVTQQIIAGGDMGHVITEHHYHQQQQQQHHEQQRQQEEAEREAAERERYREATIQHVQVVTSQHDGGVPTAVTEQVVRAMPPQHHRLDHPDHHQDRHPDRHGDQAVVHQLIPMTMPHEAELVMSMMHAHQANISQTQ